MSLTPASVEASRIRQRTVTDERRGREGDRLLHHGRRRGQDPGDLQEPLAFLQPRRRLLPVELAKVLHGCGQERIPSGSRTRGPLVQHLLLFFSTEGPEVPGQVMQDRPCEVSIGPPGAYRVGVVAECDPGRLARVSYRVYRGPVRCQRLQPTVRLPRRSTCGEPAPGLRVWRLVRDSTRTGDPGWPTGRILSGKSSSGIRGKPSGGRHPNPASSGRLTNVTNARSENQDPVDQAAGLRVPQPRAVPQRHLLPSGRARPLPGRDGCPHETLKRPSCWLRHRKRKGGCRRRDPRGHRRASVAPLSGSRNSWARFAPREPTRPASATPGRHDSASVADRCACTRRRRRDEGASAETDSARGCPA